MDISELEHKSLTNVYVHNKPSSSSDNASARGAGTSSTLEYCIYWTMDETQLFGPRFKILKK